MGKRQHQKDKMYLTYTEWTTLYGGKKEGPEADTFRRLPYNHCCVSLKPFEHPYCDKDGNIFELEALLGYLNKYNHNPVTGKPLDKKKLIKLNFAKNANGEYHCPVLYKLFSKQSHIVAIASTGNVYSFEAVDRLNIKPKNFKDLLTDQTFSRAEIITLQDPTRLNKFNLTEFHHLKNDLKVETEEEIALRKDSNSRLKNISNETKDILEELDKEYVPAQKELTAKNVADKFNAAHYSTGAVAAAFTSTSMEPVMVHEAAIIDRDTIRYQRVKKKGYVRLVTNLGNLNLELHCDLVPKTCENFLKLCQRGYYDNTIFHRSIRHFMIQGGDPTGSGAGGQSIWGKEFADEFKSNLSHTGRGVLSMANSGPDSNKSQFFITFRSCPHLDKKHTIFGQLVGGSDVLNEMERIPVDNKDRPVHDIRVLKSHIFVDPYEEVDQQLAADREAEKAGIIANEAEKKSKKTAITLGDDAKSFGSGVGKYINPERIPRIHDEAASVEPTVKKKKEAGNNQFSDFSSW